MVSDRVQPLLSDAWLGVVQRRELRKETGKTGRTCPAKERAKETKLSHQPIGFVSSEDSLTPLLLRNKTPLVVGHQASITALGLQDAIPFVCCMLFEISVIRI